LFRRSVRSVSRPNGLRNTNFIITGASLSAGGAYTQRSSAAGQHHVGRMGFRDSVEWALGRIPPRSKNQGLPRLRPQQVTASNVRHVVTGQTASYQLQPSVRASASFTGNGPLSQARTEGWSLAGSESASTGLPVNERRSGSPRTPPLCWMATLSGAAPNIGAGVPSHAADQEHQTGSNTCRLLPRTRQKRQKTWGQPRAAISPRTRCL